MSQLLRDSCPQLKSLIAGDVIRGRSGKTFRGSALSTENNLLLLQHLMNTVRPQKTIEIGLCFGGSAILFCADHRQRGASASAQHVAIDPFQATVWDDAGLLAIEQANLREYLDFHQSFSSVALPQLWKEGQQFQLAYVDGSHLFEDVFIDLYYLIRLVERDGIIAFDDCTDRHVRKVIRFVQTNLTDILQEIDLFPCLLPEQRTWKRNVAWRFGWKQFRAFRKKSRTDREWNSPFNEF